MWKCTFMKSKDLSDPSTPYVDVILDDDELSQLQAIAEAETNWEALKAAKLKPVEWLSLPFFALEWLYSKRPRLLSRYRK